MRINVHTCMSWMIAKDMAQLNAENLSRLSHKGFKARFNGSKKAKKHYQDKHASPELLIAIRHHHIQHNKKVRLKRTVLLIAVVGIISTMIYLAIMYMGSLLQ